MTKNNYARPSAVLLALALITSPALAEVTRIEISSRQDVLAGKAFGTTGAYEKLSGKVYFAVNSRPMCLFSGPRMPRAPTASCSSMS